MSAIVTGINFESRQYCWGCNLRGEDEFIIKHYCKLKIKNAYFDYCICMKCYKLNENNKFMQCINCLNSFKLDFTQLNVGDKIKYGMYTFLFCDDCMIECKDKCIGKCHGALTNLYFTTR